MLAYNRGFFSPLLSSMPKAGEAIQISIAINQGKMQTSDTRVSAVAIDKEDLTARAETAYSFISRIPGYIRGLFNDQKINETSVQKAEATKQKKEKKPITKAGLSSIEDSADLSEQQELLLSDTKNNIYQVTLDKETVSLFKVTEGDKFISGARNVFINSGFGTVRQFPLLE